LKLSNYNGERKENVEEVSFGFVNYRFTTAWAVRWRKKVFVSLIRVRSNMIDSIFGLDNHAEAS
jgi:hypothetical protein